jgi:hypothetical protein
MLGEKRPIGWPGVWKNFVSQKSLNNLGNILGLERALARHLNKLKKIFFELCGRRKNFLDFN